jgi:parallel beta-helix repeat protein
LWRSRAAIEVLEPRIVLSTSGINVFDQAVTTLEVGSATDMVGTPTEDSLQIEDLADYAEISGFVETAAAGSTGLATSTAIAMTTALATDVVVTEPLIGSAGATQDNQQTDDPVEIGGIYYVSLSGNNNWDGLTPGTAFRTITKGAQVITAGDTLIIASGNYGSEHVEVIHSGTANAPILIRAETAGGVLLDGGTGSGKGLSIVDASYITVEGLKFTNYFQALYCKRAAHITVRESIFVDNDAAGITISLATLDNMGMNHHYLFTENQFLDPAGGERQDYGLCLYFADHVEVLNNYFYGEHHQACSFKELMSDSRVAGNTFDGFLYSAIYLGQNDDVPQGRVVRSSNLIAEDNVFRPASGYGAKRAIAVANVSDAIVRNNFIDSIYGSHTAIDIAPNSTGTEVYGNTIINVRYESGMELRTSDCEVYNNTIAGCDTGIAIVNGANPVLRNNIFHDNGQQVRILSAPNYPSDGSAEHSAYYNPDAAHLWVWSPDYAGDPLFEHNDWYAPNYSGHGATDISVNPQFVGPLTNLVVGGLNPVFEPDFSRADAYRLDGCRSDCIDAGMDVGLPYNGDAPDIGAFEVVPADFNSDGYVDDKDLNIWEDHFGTTAGANRSDGDADCDGDVDGIDFLSWQRNISGGTSLGAVAASSASSVPTDAGAESLGAAIEASVTTTLGDPPLAASAITTFSSTVTSGTATNKTGDQDLMYLMTEGGAVLFQVTATDAEAYEWQVNKEVQSGVTGDSFTWTVPSEGGIWEIHLKVTGGGSEVHQEWAISTLSSSESPDFFESFSDGKWENRTETDPWDRALPEWRKNDSDDVEADASTRAMKMDGDLFNGAMLYAPHDATMGTWTAKFRETPAMASGDERVTIDFYALTTGNRSGPKASISMTAEPQGHNWPRVQTPEYHMTACHMHLLGCWGVTDYDSFKGSNAGQWKDLKMIRDDDGFVRSWKGTGRYGHNGYFIDSQQDANWLAPEDHIGEDVYDQAMNIGIMARTDNVTSSWGEIDSIAMYKDEFISPKTITYGSYVDSYGSSSPRYRTGILVDGFDVGLADIAQAINDPSRFSYDSVTKTAHCYTDLCIRAGAELVMNGETLIMHSASDGEHQIRVKNGTFIDLLDSTITTADSHAFEWVFPSPFTPNREYGSPYPSNLTGRFHARNTTINNCGGLYFSGATEVVLEQVKLTNMVESTYPNPPDSGGVFAYWCGQTGPDHALSFWGHQACSRFLIKGLEMSARNGQEVTMRFLSMDTVVENTTIYDAVLQDVDILAKEAYFYYWGLKHPTTLSLVNTQFGDLIVETNNAAILPKYYLDVQVVDTEGLPVEGVTVTVTNEVDPEQGPMNIRESFSYVRGKGYDEGGVGGEELLSRKMPKYGDPIFVTTTGADGHIPLPQDVANTMVLADFAKTNTGTTPYTYKIIAEKGDYRRIARGVDPGPTWLRTDPNSPTHTVVLVLEKIVEVSGRHVFYNDSDFDGNDGAANAADDGAIAPDKTALLPGETAAFANYTSYSRGINGIMVDIESLPGTPTAADFTFRVGNPDHPAGTVLDANFDSGTDSFAYADDTFRNTNNPYYATGYRISSGGHSGGALKVRVGNIDGVDITDGLSGGWSRTFTLSETAETSLSLWYNLTQADEYESYEFAEALVSVDGQLFGTDGHDYLAQLVGGGATGWQQAELDLGMLLAGEHTLIIGAYNNQKTHDDEFTEILIDDVKVEIDVDPSGTWTAAPAPTSVTVRPGEGEEDSGRVTILWADNAIEKEWLQVTVLATANTGLEESDLFYFGNAIGESGNSTSDAFVNTIDELGAHNNPTDSAELDNVHDYDRDGLVNSTDELLASGNTTDSTTALRLMIAQDGTVGLVGDFNADSYVNGEDLNIWEGHFGTTTGAKHSDGDADGDGDVDGIDFLSWQRNISGVPSSGAAVSGAAAARSAVLVATSVATSETTDADGGAYFRRTAEKNLPVVAGASSSSTAAGSHSHGIIPTAAHFSPTDLPQFQSPRQQASVQEQLLRHDRAVDAVMTRFDVRTPHADLNRLRAAATDRPFATVSIRHDDIARHVVRHVAKAKLDDFLGGHAVLEAAFEDLWDQK